MAESARGNGRRAREHVVDHDRGNGGSEAERSRHQRHGDARRDREICGVCAFEIPIKLSVSAPSAPRSG